MTFLCIARPGGGAQTADKVGAPSTFEAALTFLRDRPWVHSSELLLVAETETLAELNQRVFEQAEKLLERKEETPQAKQS